MRPHIYALADSIDGRYRYVGKATKNPKRRNVHTENRGAKSTRTWFREMAADRRQAVRKILFYCEESEAARMEQRAWDVFKRNGHPLLNARPMEIPEEAAKRGRAKGVINGRAVHAAAGFPGLKKGRATQAAAGHPGLKKALAAQAANGFPNLKKGLATNSARGFSDFKKAGAKGRATQEATGRPWLKEAGMKGSARGVEVRAAAGFPELKRGLATNTRSGFLNLAKGRAAYAARRTADPAWWREVVAKQEAARAATRERKCGMMASGEDNG